MKEINQQKLNQMRASQLGARVWRNNVGGAWSGQKVKALPNGDIILRNPRWIDFGLAKGSGDDIGFYPVTITSDMVGTVIAQFLNLETKTLTGRSRDDQVKWHEFIHNNGGLSGFARCENDVDRILKGEKVDP